MKSDLAMYVIAIACFILAAVTVSEFFVKEELMKYTLTVAFAALGIIFLGVGYTLRPKMEAAMAYKEVRTETAKIEEPQPAATIETQEVIATTAEEEISVSKPAEPAAESSGETAAISPTPVETPVAEPQTGLTNVKGIGPKRAEQLQRLGIYTIYDLANADGEDLAKKTELSPKITSRWVEEAKKLVQA